MKKTSEQLKEIMTKLPIVKWDRIIPVSETYLCLFGWINREKDIYKDIVVLDILDPLGQNNWRVNASFTSSAKYSKEISDIFDFDHTDCIDVDLFIEDLIEGEVTESQQ